LFTLRSAPETFLGFAVDPESAVVIESGVVSVAVSGDEWVVRNDAAGSR
jgi:hypothetical protein